LPGGDRIVAHDVDLGAQLHQVMDQVEGEAVVVVDDQDHGARLRRRADERNRTGLVESSEMHYIHEMKTSAVTATEANRSFSKLLRAVQRGERIEITSHGRTVAVLAPAESE